MTSPYRIERDRGTKEARQQLAVLHEKWPLAFPVEHQDVRPLAMGVARQVATAMGWSFPYTLGVLGRWKMAEVQGLRLSPDSAPDAALQRRPSGRRTVRWGATWA
jgi:hypothetical protein